jgi:hypothetical protein
MSNEQICSLFDRKPDMSIKTLAMLAGKTVSEIKKILLTVN